MPKRSFTPSAGAARQGSAPQQQAPEEPALRDAAPAATQPGSVPAEPVVPQPAAQEATAQEAVAREADTEEAVAEPAAQKPVAPSPPAPAPADPQPAVSAAPLTPPGPPLADRPAADPRAHTADELTEYTIVRRRSDRPVSGWRRAVHTASGGLINPGIGPAEQRRQDMALRIRRPLPGPRQVAIVSMKGGVGKTTVTAVLGLMLAEHRGDRIVALDANPDAGTLAERLTGRTDATVRDLLDSLDTVEALSDIARFTSLSGRLQVLASEQDPARSEAFDRSEYERVCAVLSRFYNVVVTDSGTGMVHSAMDGTLALANSLVVVGSHTVDGASRAGKTLDWLVAHGHKELADRAVVVLSHDRTSPEVDGERIVGYFKARCRAVVEVPRDPHLATGGRIEVDKLRQATSDAFLELAALVADDLGNPPPVRQN